MINEQDIKTVNAANSLLSELTLHDLKLNERYRHNGIEIVAVNKENPRHSGLTYEIRHESDHVTLHVIKFQSGTVSLQMVDRDVNVWNLIGRLASPKVAEPIKIKPAPKSYKLHEQLDGIIGSSKSRAEFNGFTISRVPYGFSIQQPDGIRHTYKYFRKPYSNVKAWNVNGGKGTKKELRELLGLDKFS